MEGGSRWERRLPGVAMLRRYERGWLRGDVVGGLTIAAYLVPQVLAYAVLAGLSPVVGLWATIVPMALYFLLGSSWKLSVGPDSITSLMTAAGVGALVGMAGGPDRYAEVAAIMAIAVGIVCLAGFVARLGFVTRLLSRPVLIGYLVGIAVLMIASQFEPATKVPVTGDGTIAETWSFVTGIGQTHLPTLLLTLITLASLYVLGAVLPRWPGALIVLVAAAAVVAIIGPERAGLDVVGAVPAGLPVPRLPALGDLSVWAMLPYAVGIAVVSFSDNVLAGRAFATREQPIDPDQELLALGVANVGAGLFQGFPISSSGSRTVIGDTVGARTQVASLVVVACVIATLLFAGPVLASFPDAALSALVIYAATKLVEVGEIRRIARFRRSELVLTVITAIGVGLFGVLIGIGVAIGLSILDLVRRITRPHASVLGFVPDVAGMHSLDVYPEATQVAGLVVFRYDSPLFFANADDFLTRALAAVDDARPEAEWFLLNAEANIEVDVTAVDVLDQLRRSLADRGVRLAIARLKQELHERLAPTGLVDDIGDEYIFATLPTAVEAYADWYERRHGSPPTGLPPRDASGP